MVHIAPTDISLIELTNEHGMPRRRYSVAVEPYSHSLASFRGTSVHPRMVVDTTSPLNVAIGQSALSLLSTT